MGLHRRLEELEGRRATSKRHGAGTTERGWERFFHAHENAKREVQGLEPLPELEHTEEDYHDDLRWLAEGIPTYRRSVGMQTEEARAMLDGWEEETRGKTESYEATRKERND